MGFFVAAIILRSGKTQRRRPLFAGAMVLVGAIGFSACNAEKDAANNADIKRYGRIGIFYSAESDCTLSPEKMILPHRTPGEKAVSSDARWLALARPEASYHAIELFDRSTKIKTILFHPNIEVQLSDLNFSADSKTFTFVGSPWTGHGIGEIFIVDLPNLEISRYGEAGHTYRFPIAINPQKDLIFLEGIVGPWSPDRSLLLKASHESIAYYVGLRRAEGGVSYLLNIEDGGIGNVEGKEQTLFAPFRRSHKDFLEVVADSRLGVAAGAGSESVTIYDSMARLGPGMGYMPEKSGKIVIDLADAANSKVTVENVDFQDEVERLDGTGRVWKMLPDYALEATDIGQTRSVCLELAEIQ